MCLGVALADQVVVICTQDTIPARRNGGNRPPQREIAASGQFHVQAAVSFLFHKETSCALKHFMVKSRTDKNCAAEKEPVCCQQCVIACRLYDTGNGQLGGVRPVDLIPGFILPGITPILDTQLVSGRKNRFNQRTAIRLEA